MYYTTYITKQTQQISYTDLFNSEYNPQAINSTCQKYRHTLQIPATQFKVNKQVSALAEIINKYCVLFQKQKDAGVPLYEDCYIPKKSGGFRKLSIPNDSFKTLLTAFSLELQDIHILEHNAAYAYVKGRCTIDAVKKHQENNSYWFLKIDLKDFFPSCTPNFCAQQIFQVYPFALLDKATQENFLTILQIHEHNGLPQGSPLSPYLTNLLMVPIDYHIQNTLMHYKHNHFVYTRYADDMLISCKSSFNFKEIIEYIKPYLKSLKINEEKIRYGSRAGRNWNLGVMLNKDNNITLGYKQKKVYQAMINNFLRDFQANQAWDLQNTQILQGKLAYLRAVEPEYYQTIVQKYSTKFNLNFENVLQRCLII